MESGVVEHHGTFGRVKANDPRPLLQAIAAIREEYGLVINYEDPPFDSEFDLVDDTDPNWRASHPRSKGVWRVAGGAFQSDYPEAATSVPSSRQLGNLLNKVVTDYNRSGNPGMFVVRMESASRYSIIGVSKRDSKGNPQQVTSLLDTPITLPSERRTAVETLLLILTTVSATSGVKLLPLMVPTNAMQATDVTVGGTNVPARALLLRTLGAANARRTLMWDMIFDPDPNTNAYLFSVQVAVQNSVDAAGKPTKRPMDHIE
jgi:hypothetical protein